MQNITIIAALIFITSSLSAQFGLRFSSQWNDYKSWNTVTQSASTPSNSDLFGQSFEIGIDYWFRLKNTRLEFYPEVGFGYSKSTNSINNNDAFPLSYNLKKVYGGINAHIYFLDLKGDCDCPTFSKQNDFFKKGFFLMISSKIHYQNKETIYFSDSIKDNDLAVEISAGLGLDIGISDLVTISPFAALSYFPSSNWDGININHGIIHILPPDESTSNIAWKLGIRVGFRPDYLKNKY
ncbi:MAG: hypothetical protein V3V00_13760 [Saprospiraceae bacterium]